MKIRTWQERCEDFDDMYITTSRDLYRVKQEEIDDLRAEVDRLQGEYKRGMLDAAEIAENYEDNLRSNEIATFYDTITANIAIAIKAKAERIKL